MEDQNQFSRELLQMMREEEREKFLAALKDGASWGQLYQIRNNIRKINEMLETAERDKSSQEKEESDRSNQSKGPRYSPKG
jgi:hypothetical protein